MKTITASSLRAAALATSLFLLTLAAFAHDSAPSDRASALLASQGSIAVASAGPYVEIGTYAIQVTAKLGRPAASLPDGTWLYENFSAEDSAARGTLVVRFVQGRVSSLALATPAVVAALRTAPKSGVLVAQQDRR
jgi:hypothetical protein